MFNLKQLENFVWEFVLHLQTVISLSEEWVSEGWVEGRFSSGAEKISGISEIDFGGGKKWTDQNVKTYNKISNGGGGKTGNYHFYNGAFHYKSVRIEQMVEQIERIEQSLRIEQIEQMLQKH